MNPEISKEDYLKLIISEYEIFRCGIEQPFPAADV